MAKLSKKDMEELKEFLSLGCDYSGTKDTMVEVANETLKEFGMDLDIDCMGITDGDKEISLDNYLEKIYEKMIEKVLNVVWTQGR